MIGSEDRLRNVSRDLFINGIWAEALIYPAVEPGQARIRFRASAAHTREDLDFVLKKAGEVLS
jgi:glycine C-acetyltransferase